MYDSTEVIIVGAGLAGCAAAIELGRRGVSALVLEKGYTGKDKPCGDAFIPSAISVLEEYGLHSEDFFVLQGMPFREIAIYDNTHLVEKNPLFNNRVGWMLPRNLIDQKLRDMAQKNVKLFYNCSVQNIENELNNRWKVSCLENNVIRYFYSKAVILATGALNKFSKKWNISGEPYGSVSISAYASLEKIGALIFESTYLCKPGYGWLFTLSRDKVNIGICSLSSNETDLKKIAEKYMRRWNVDEKVKWRGGQGPLWSGKSSIWHDTSGLISCGDAAGLIDPLNSEGITAALISGKNAGKYISDYIFNDCNPIYLKKYSDFIYDYCFSRYSETANRKIWGTFH